jgi:hypothetical protein
MVRTIINSVKTRPLLFQALMHSPVQRGNRFFGEESAGNPGLVGDYHCGETALIEKPYGINSTGNQPQLLWIADVALIGADDPVPVKKYRPLHHQKFSGPAIPFIVYQMPGATF